MRTSDAIRRAITGDPSPVTDLGELSREYGGTAGLARELGVSRRTAQRYLAPEGRQRRQPAARLRPRLAQLGRAAGERRRIAEFASRGITVRFAGKLRVSETEDLWPRKITQYLGPELLGPFLRDAQAHRWTAATGAFEANFGDAYGIGQATTLSRVDRLGFTAGYS